MQESSRCSKHCPLDYRSYSALVRSASMDWPDFKHRCSMDVDVDLMAAINFLALNDISSAADPWISLQF